MGPSQGTEVIQTHGDRKLLLWRTLEGFNLLLFPAFKPGKQTGCHEGHAYCTGTHGGLALAGIRRGTRPRAEAKRWLTNTRGGLRLSPGHPSHPPPAGPGAREILWLWLGEAGKMASPELKSGRK